MTDPKAEALEPDSTAEEPKAQEPESAEPAPADDAVADTTETPEKKPSRRDKRIDQLTGEKYALKEDRDYWRNKALSQPEPAKVETPKPEPPKQPKLADFNHDIEAYAEALADYTEKSIQHAKTEAVTEIKETTTAATAKQSQQDYQRQRLERFNEKSTEFAEEHADYYEIVSNDSLNITEQMMDVMLELDNTPGVLYHLGLHPEIAHRIAQKSPVAAAVELGKIEISLAGSKTPASATTSNAPEPPSPISTSKGTSTKRIDDPNLTDKEFSDLRRKQIAARS